MTRKMIPLTVKTETIDMATGEATPGTATMMMLPAADGRCEMCATEHEPELPHNVQSLFYQMRFHQENGRYPDWRDAMAHCDDAMKELWTNALAEKGVDVAAGQIVPARRA